jgi:FkbM family methyltransferase
MRFRAAQVVRAVPSFPGRDALLSRLLPGTNAWPDAPLQGCFGGGLRFEGNPRSERYTVQLALLRWARPALASLFDSVLSPGDLFADVGANNGLYSLWAARLVGARGRVHAFEPDPDTAARLRRNAELNGFSQIEVHVRALGEREGTVRLHRWVGASGRTSRYATSPGLSQEIEVPMTSLDAHFAGSPPPKFVKIDVEGMEVDVLRGAEGLLSAEQPPLVVFESHASSFEGSGVPYAEVLRFLGDLGYGVFSLGRHGVAPEPAGALEPGSLNVLGARVGHEPHDTLLARLRSVPFPSNQNV